MSNSELKKLVKKKMFLKYLLLFLFLILCVLPILGSIYIVRDVYQGQWQAFGHPIVAWILFFTNIMAWVVMVAMLIGWLLDKKLKAIFVWFGCACGLISWIPAGSAALFGLPAVLVACFLMKYHLRWGEYA